MKRSIKYLTVVLVIVITSGSILFAQNSNKLAPNDGGGNGTQKFIGCSIYEEGVLIMVGGRCGQGTHACSSNPCY